MKISTSVFPWRFIILAYSIAWVCWIPVAMTRQDYQSSPLLLALVFLGDCGPGVAGVILTYRESGREGGRDFWHRVFDFRRISLRWYALILLLYPALHLVAILINAWLGGSPPRFDLITRSMSMPGGILIFVALYLLQAGLEELGWRGYLLDRLQLRWKPLTAALVLGVVHTFWHLPLFFMTGTNQSRFLSGFAFLMFMAFVISGSIVCTWCYNENRRSILAVILLHTVANLALDIFMLSGNGEYIFKALSAIFAVFVVMIWMQPLLKPKQVRST